MYGMWRRITYITCIRWRHVAWPKVLPHHALFCSCFLVLVRHSTGLKLFCLMFSLVLRRLNMFFLFQLVCTVAIEGLENKWSVFGYICFVPAQRTRNRTTKILPLLDAPYRVVQRVKVWYCQPIWLQSKSL